MFLQGTIGMIVGLAILTISILGYWSYNTIAGWINDAPQVGPELLSWLNSFRFPGGQVLFPALGIFLVVWSGALMAKRSWARIVGIAISVFVVFHLFALAILVIPYWDGPVMAQYRWWIAAIWLVLLSLSIYQVYHLVAPATELQFAAQYINQRVVTQCDRCGKPLDSRGRCPNCEAPASETSESPAPQRAAQAEPQRPATTSTQPKSAPRQAPPPQATSGPGSEVPLARLVDAEGKPTVMRRFPFRVGRAPENDLVLEDATVSGQHAQILYQSGQFAVEDKGSTNGTYVNGAKVERSRLETQAEIEFGRVRFTFEITADS